MHRLSAYVIVHQTQTNQTPNANQSDTERNPIRRRTESDRTANANDRGAAVSATPTKQTEQGLHQQSLQSYHFTNRSLIHAQRGIMRHAATSSR